MYVMISVADSYSIRTGMLQSWAYAAVGTVRATAAALHGAGRGNVNLRNLRALPQLNVRKASRRGQLLVTTRAIRKDPHETTTLATYPWTEKMIAELIRKPFWMQMITLHVRNDYLSNSKTFQDGNGNGNFGEINSNDFQDGNWESMEMKG